MVDWLGEANLSRLGIILLAVGVGGMPLSQNLPMLAIAVALLPLGTAFTFPCVTALLSRVIQPRERGLYMGMQQTYGGISRIIAPLFFGWAFDHIGVSAPYFFSSAFILATIFLGFGLDQYARPGRKVAPAMAPITEPGAVATGSEAQVARAVAAITEPEADRGPRAGSPRGVVDATGSEAQVAPAVAPLGE